MENTKLYCNPAITKIIKALYFQSVPRKRALAARFQDKCVSSLEGRNEKELPPSMIAFVATGVCPLS